jgi:hypothetical protein
MSNMCVFKSLLLFVLVLGVFAIFYTYVNPTNPTTTTTSTAATTTQPPLQQKLAQLDKFLDVTLKELSATNSTASADSILTDYNKLITPTFISNIRDSGTVASRIYSENQSNMVTKLNTMDKNLKPIFDTLNTNLYKQLGKNYSRSQQINSIREDWLQNINELPYAALNR